VVRELEGESLLNAPIPNQTSVAKTARAAMAAASAGLCSRGAGASRGSSRMISARITNRTVAGSVGTTGSTGVGEGAATDATGDFFFFFCFANGSLASTWLPHREYARWEIE
jgi:hypothetical protein